jgi:hypothetical protein
MELEALIVGQLQSDHAPPPLSEIVTTSPATPIPAATRGSKTPILESSRDRDVEPPVAQPLLEDVSYALRIEKLLGDINARIVALTELLPPSIPDLNSPPAIYSGSAPDEKGSSQQDVPQNTSSSVTAKVLHALSRESLREAVRCQKNHFAELARKQRSRLGQIYEAAAPLLAKLAKGAANTQAFPWPFNNLNRFGSCDDRPAGILGARPTLVLVLVNSLLVLGVSFLLTRPKGVETAQRPLVVNQIPHLRALDARDPAMVKTAASSTPVEIKVNSLEATIALLSPKPISGGVSGASGELAPSLSAPPKSAPVALDPSELNAPQPEPAAPMVQTALQSDSDLLDARAAVGDAAAQYDYATELYKSGDTKGAVSWLEKSAKQGNSKAQLQLGILYLKGNGVTRNFAQARKWLETAATNGDPLAMHNLAVLYSGTEGRRPDLTRASEWFRRAAEEGVVDSMVNLGLSYSNGLGVEKDLIQAYAWFSLAASKGDAKAAQKRKELGKFLNRDELSEAKALTDSLKLTQRTR